MAYNVGNGGGDVAPPKKVDRKWLITTTQTEGEKTAQLRPKDHVCTFLYLVP